MNNTIRVCKPLMKRGIDAKTVLDLRHIKDMKPPPSEENTALMTINLFLETPEGHGLGNEGILHTIQQDDLLIFIKYYDPVSMELYYLGHMFVEKTCRFRMVLNEAKKMAGLGLEDEVVGVKEVQHLPEVICEDLLSKRTVFNNRIIQGDIVIIQKLVRDDDFAYPLVKGFLEFIQSSQKDKSKNA